MTDANRPHDSPEEPQTVDDEVTGQEAVDATWDSAPSNGDEATEPSNAAAAADKEAAKQAKKAEKEAQKRAKAEAKAAAKEAKRQAKEAKKATKGKKAQQGDDGDQPDAPAIEPAQADVELTPEGDPDGELEPEGEPMLTAQTSGAASVEAHPNDWGAVGDAEFLDDEALADAEAELAEGEVEKHPRMGLRLGAHQKGGLLAQIKARLGLAKDEPSEATVMQQEEEEALAERIEPDARYKEVETYPIHPPYAHVRILFDDDMKEYVYQVLEPVLTKTEKEILDFIEATLVDTLSVSPEELEDADELEFITERFNDVIFDYSIILHEDEAEEVEIKKKLLYYIRRNFIGHGPIDAIMEDPFIEDISCDGPHVPIFLYHRKYESMRSTVIFGEHEILDSYVIKMAQRAGKHISIAEPILDATMTDGSRLQSTLAKEVSAAGSTFTIRKFRPDPFTPPDLVMFRTMSAEMLAYLWIAVQNGASIMYAGGTASGKTTSLNAILLFIPPNMKIVSIEDTREVNLPHENWIAGITRHGFGPRDQFGRQAGEIDMFQLLKNALRQRPEYIIVGEVRGQEAYSLFQAMATGHAAYGTMHADSVDAVIHRLESDPINIPRSLLEALDIVSVQIQTRVDGKRVRRTKQISEIVGLDPHTREILTNEVFRWQPEDDSFRFSGVSYSLEKIQIEKGLPAGAMIKELKRRAQIIAWMIDRKIQNYKEVNKVVSAYYKEPETVAKLVNGELGPDEIPIGLREIAERGDQVDDNPLSASALAASKVSLEGGSDEPEAPAASPAPDQGESQTEEVAEHDDASPLAAATHAQEMEDPSPSPGPLTAGLEPQGDAPWQTPQHEAPETEPEARPEPYTARQPDHQPEAGRHAHEAPESQPEARPEPYTARQPDQHPEAGHHAHEAPESQPEARPEPYAADRTDQTSNAAQGEPSPEPQPAQQPPATRDEPASELPWGGRPERNERAKAPAKPTAQEASKPPHPDLPWQKTEPRPAAATEKAVDWKGMDALIESAEVHAKSQPDEAEGEAADEWLSEREREVREAKTERDEAVADKQARDEAEGPKDAEGRRVKRASGGDDAE